MSKALNYNIESLQVDKNQAEYTNCIEIKNVIKDYKMGNFVVRALDRTTLIIPKTKLVVILGPSGSGKTTLLNLIGALDNATQGKIKVLGKNISDLS